MSTSQRCIINQSMEKIRTPLIVIISVLIGIFGYMTYQSMTSKSTAPTETNLENIPVSSPTVSAVTPTTSTDNSWEKYSSVPLGFSINHPADLSPTKQAETIVFYKQGPSQGGETEFYDGISLTFGSGMYDGNFESLVNTKLQEVKDWPTYVSSTEIKALTLAGKEAYSFEAVTMGKATYYFIKKNQTEYFEIVDATNDPTNQEFKDIVSQMLTSLKINE